MANEFISIKVDGIDYSPTDPIELIPANQATLLSYLNSLGFGTFMVNITDTNCPISILQTAYNIQSVTTTTGTYAFLQTNCGDFNNDDTVYCQYQLSSSSDTVDNFIGIVVDAVLYSPPSPILATNVAAVQAYLNNASLNFITYSNNGGIYMVTSLTNHNVSYIKIQRNDEIITIQFVEYNCHVPIYGCKNPWADNYNPDADFDDGSCVFGTKKFGCTDPAALNYDPTAQINDDSCIYEFQTDKDRLKCCAGRMAYNIAVKEQLGEKTPCCSYKKLNYILSVIDMYDEFRSPTEYPDDYCLTVEEFEKMVNIALELCEQCCSENPTDDTVLYN